MAAPTDTPPAGFYVAAPPAVPYLPPAKPAPIDPARAVFARAQQLAGQINLRSTGAPTSPQNPTAQGGRAGSLGGIAGQVRARAARLDTTRVAAVAGEVRARAAQVDTARVATVAGQVGRVAATHAERATLVAAAHTGRAARATVGAVKDFWTGVGAFWLGLWTFLKSPMLWLLAVVPAVVVYSATFAGRAGADTAAAGVAGWASGLAESWPSALRGLLEFTVKWGLTGLAYMLIGFLVVPLALIAGAPFLVATVRWMERRLGGPASADRPGWWRAIGFVISQTVLVTVTIAFGGLVLVPILFIPGINLLVATILAVLVNGFVIGLLAAGPPLHHSGVGERLAHLRYVWRRRWPTLGFGTMSVLVLSIPFAPLRWFTIPAVFVGAVLLYRRFPHESEG